MRAVTFGAAFAAALALASAVTLSVADIALAATVKSCKIGRTTAPFLSSTAGRTARVSGSILVVTRSSAAIVSTPGVRSPRTTRPAVGPGEAWLGFCVRRDHVARGTALVTTRAGGIAVVATGPRRLALIQTRARRVRTVDRISLTSRPQLVAVVLDRIHQQASLFVNGARRASVGAPIPATTVVAIGSATHPVRSALVAVPSVAAGSSTKAAPPSSPSSAPTSTAPSSTTTSTKATAAPTGVTTAATTATTTTAPTTTTTSGTPTTPAPAPPAGPGGTGDTGTSAGLTASQASTVPFNAFSPASFWNTPLAATAPLDPGSASYVSDLVSQVNSYGAWLNTTSYSIPAYVVPADQPTVTVHLTTWGPDLQQQFNAVPIPPGAQPAAGTDGSLTVWQPSTDKLWDFWQLSESSAGAWSARWGGEMDDVSTNPGYFTHSGQTDNWGATASGLPLLGGLITIADLKRGYINHALALAVPQATQGVFSWPAQRTDGRFTGGVAIPEGMRFRLDPTLDIDSLNLPYFEKMLAQAAQTYGIVVRDQSGCVSFYAQDPTTTGSNPWVSPFDGWSEGTYLSWFPWSHLQALKTQLSAG